MLADLIGISWGGTNAFDAHHDICARLPALPLGRKDVHQRIMSGIGIRVIDLLAISFVRHLGWRFIWAKLMFETGFVVLALIFGGPVGLATVCFVLMVGTLIPPIVWAHTRYFRLPNDGLAPVNRLECIGAP